MFCVKNKVKNLLKRTKVLNIIIFYSKYNFLFFICGFGVEYVIWTCFFKGSPNCTVTVNYTNML